MSSRITSQGVDGMLSDLMGDEDKTIAQLAGSAGVVKSPENKLQLLIQILTLKTLKQIATHLP